MIWHHVLQTLPLSYAEERAPWSTKHPETCWENFADCIACLNLPWFTPLQVPQLFHSRIHRPSNEATRVVWFDFCYYWITSSICSISEVGVKGKKSQLCVRRLVWNPGVFLQQQWLTCNSMCSLLDVSPLKIAFCCWNLVYRGLSITF